MMAAMGMDEDARIARWTAGWFRSAGVRRGPGDDCALVAPPPRGCEAVLKTDAVLEGVHFTCRDPAAWVGRKALARAVSDFAATGAHPVAVLVACMVPTGSCAAAYADRAMAGMAAAARRWGIGLAGGETTRGPLFGLTVSLYGWVRRKNAVARSGARVGDILCVTGRLGGSRAGHHLRFEPRLAEGQWLAQGGWVRAMMDLSDGLGKDLPRLALASGHSFSIDPQRLPRRRGVDVEGAVNDGEDYELLFAVAPERVADLRRKWPFRTPWKEIGVLLPRRMKPETGGIPFFGYDHFS